MRYLSLLFFIFLSLHSYFVFANEFPHPDGCTQVSFYGGPQATVNSVRSGCSANANVNLIKSYSISGTPYVRCMSCTNPCFPGQVYDPIAKSCSCPAGTTSNTVISGGKATTSCLPDNPDPTGECPSGVNPETGLCNNDDLCPSGYPKVNGQCPVCLEGQNEDGTCATPSSEPSSSAPNSSSPDTGSSGSAGSSGGGGGDGDGSGPGSGGGGDGGNGGNNGGGGSASAASASSVSGTGSSSGTNNSWNPYSGYGNWIPISENSPCPNKYQDISGQWWCAGGNSGNGSSSGNTGSAGSLASAGSSAGQCDPTSRDYLKCISSGNSSAQSNSSQSSSTGSNSSGATSSLGDKGEFDGEDAEKKLEEIQEDLSQKIDDIKTEIQNEFASAISGTGTIQDFCKNIRGSEVCFGMQKFESWLDPISQAIFLVSCVLSFAIVLGGRN